MRRLTNDERKKISLEIMKEIHEIAQRHDLTYFLAYGTLLGAIRHQGFIPWDDDLDIWVPADEYYKFLSIIDEESNYDVLEYSRNNGWDWHFAKINRNDTRLKKWGSNQFEIRGVAVDVFPLANYKEGVHRIVFFLVKVLNRYRMADKFAGGIKGKIYGFLSCVVSEKICFYVYKKLIESSGGKQCRGLHSPYKERDVHNKDCFDVTICKFEDAEFLIPKGYKQVLTNLYGDYMIPPPIDQRRTTHTSDIYLLENEEDFN